MQNITRGKLLSKRQPQRLKGIDSYTVLLLNCDGADESTSFDDASASNHTITANANAQVDTAQKKFGTGSALFDGTGDYLSAPDHDDWNLGSGTFTIDFWVKMPTITAESYNGFFCQYVDADNYIQLSFWDNFATPVRNLYLEFVVRSSASNVIRLTHDPVEFGPLYDGRWNHVAIIRGWNETANLWALCLNGQAVDTDTVAGASPDLAATFDIGRSPHYSIGAGGLYYLTGWIDEFRVSKGIARWTKAFVPNWGPYY